MNRLMRIVLLLALLAGISGCSHMKKWFSLPEEEIATPADMTSRQALTILKESLPRQPGPFSGQASLRMGVKDRTYGGDAEVLLSPPGRFYFEFSGPLGAAAVAASDGSILQVWNIREKKMGVMPAHEELTLMENLPVSAADFTRMTAFLPPLPEEKDPGLKEKIRGYKNLDGTVQVMVRGDRGLVHVIDFDEFATPVRYGILKDDRVVVVARYYGQPVHALLPYTTMKLSVPGRSYELTVKWRPDTIMAGVPTPPEAFRLSPPPFVTVFHGSFSLDLPTQ